MWAWKDGTGTWIGFCPRRPFLFPAGSSMCQKAMTAACLECLCSSLEWELDDEWSEGGATSVSVAKAPRVDVTLLYPHRRSGTLPLTERTSSFFQAREGKRTMFTFVDGRWGKRFPGWVVPEGRYICGLSQWYEEHGMPVGGYVVLERTNDPMEVVIDLKPHRLKREWVRLARVEGNQLRFTLQKQAVSVDYDETMVVAESDPNAIDELRRRLYKQAPYDRGPRQRDRPPTHGPQHARHRSHQDDLQRRQHAAPDCTRPGIRCDGRQPAIPGRWRWRVRHGAQLARGMS